MQRRTFLQAVAAGCGSAVAGNASPAADRHALIESIDKQTLLRGREGSGPTWFHPRACMVPGERGPMAFMTLQTILASDTFGPVHWMTSTDLGRSWTAPEPVPPLGRVPQGDRGAEGVCDVVPEWHPPTGSVLALGHNVFYAGPRFSKDQPPRWPVYAVWRDGRWGPRRRLAWDDPRGGSIYSNGCGQRLVLPDGDILLALRFSAAPDEPKAVATAVCRFDGDELTIRRVGEELRHDAGRGLLEPSLVRFGDRILITLRAEDRRDGGGVAAEERYPRRSADGPDPLDEAEWARAREGKDRLTGAHAPEVAEPRVTPCTPGSDSDNLPPIGIGVVRGFREGMHSCRDSSFVEPALRSPSWHPPSRPAPRTSTGTATAPRSTATVAAAGRARPR